MPSYDVVLFSWFEECSLGHRCGRSWTWHPGHRQRDPLSSAEDCWGMSSVSPTSYTLFNTCLFLSHIPIVPVQTFLLVHFSPQNSTGWRQPLPLTLGLFMKRWAFNSTFSLEFCLSLDRGTLCNSSSCVHACAPSFFKSLYKYPGFYGESEIGPFFLELCSTLWEQYSSVFFWDAPRLLLLWDIVDEIYITFCLYSDLELSVNEKFGVLPIPQKCEANP